jgi:hypothetical protein
MGAVFLFLKDEGKLESFRHLPKFPQGSFRRQLVLFGITILRERQAKMAA